MIFSRKILVFSLAASSMFLGMRGFASSDNDNDNSSARENTSTFRAISKLIVNFLMPFSDPRLFPSSGYVSLKPIVADEIEVMTGSLEARASEELPEEIAQGEAGVAADIEAHLPQAPILSVRHGKCMLIFSGENGTSFVDSTKSVAEDLEDKGYEAGADLEATVPCVTRVVWDTVHLRFKRVVFFPGLVEGEFDLESQSGQMPATDLSSYVAPNPVVRVWNPTLLDFR